MKKNLLVIAVIALVLGYACNTKETGGLSLEGSVKDVSEGTVYLQKFRNKTFFVIDSAAITNGEFHFSKEVELPEIYGLTLDTTKGSFLVFLDENPATVVLDSSNYYRNTTKLCRAQCHVICLLIPARLTNAFNVLLHAVWLGK